MVEKEKSALRGKVECQIRGSWFILGKSPLKLPQNPLEQAHLRPELSQSVQSTAQSPQPSHTAPKQSQRTRPLSR